MRNPWTTSESDRLTELVGDIPWPDVFNAYNKWALQNGFPRRTRNALSCQCQLLGLARVPFGGWITTGQVYRTLRISENRVRFWLAGWPDILMPYRPSKITRSRIYLRRDRIRRFARLHPEQFSGVHADDLFLLIENRDLADQVAAAYPNPPAGLKGYKRPCRPIRCLDTGDVFPSAYAVAAAIGRSHTYVCQSIRSGWRCAGLRLAWADAQEAA